jgi:hypothetical protein
MKQILFVSLPAAALALGLAGCGDDLTLPTRPTAGLSMTVFLGNGQTGTVGEPLPAQVVVVVKDADGTPSAGQPVAFIQGPGGTDTFEPDTVVTNEQGQAASEWKLGTTPGEYNAVAQVVAPQDSSPPAVTLTAAAKVGNPDTVRAISATTQLGHRNEAVGTPPRVVVVDRFGNPVPNVQVHWSADDGNGELSADETTTGADGTTGIDWTLGNRVGVQRVTAEVDGAAQPTAQFAAGVPF